MPNIPALREILGVITAQTTPLEIEDDTYNIYRTVEHPNGIALRELQEWDQATWRNIIHDVGTDNGPTCGTAMCAAGWAGELFAESVGDRWLVSARELYDAVNKREALGEALNEAYRAEKRDYDEIRRIDEEFAEAMTTVRRLRENINTILRKDGTRVSVEEWAIQYLGLSIEQASAFFGASNTAETMTAYVDRLEADPNDQLRYDGTSGILWDDGSDDDCYDE